MFLPRLPHTDVKLLLFAPDAARSVEEKHNKQTNKTQQKTKEKKEAQVPSADLSYVKLCDTAASVH